jgi:DNA replication protein DnaC
MDGTTRLALLQILEDRYGKKSVIMTSQLPVAKWHEYIGESTIADYPNFFIMRSNIMVYAVNHQLSCPNSTIYFA